ncbi:unnamed protein product [Urochloa humidicola]
MMKSLSHVNLLHVRAIKKLENEELVAVYVDEFTGVLYNMIGHMNNGFPYADADNVVPSPLLQDIISQMADGIDYLRVCGYYHGNLSLRTTLYHKHTHGYTVKLSHFQLKGAKDFHQCNRDDWVSLGESMDEISVIARSVSPQAKVGLLDNLAQKLKSFSFQSLETVRDEVKAHPFFWNSPERKNFYTADVPRALKVNTFVAEIENIPIPIPWNIDTYEGYLTDMVQYRADRHLTAYDKEDKVDHVRCISGMFTHEMQYRGNRRSVDRVMQVRNYLLCLHLKEAMS